MEQRPIRYSTFSQPWTRASAVPNLIAKRLAALAKIHASVLFVGVVAIISMSMQPTRAQTATQTVAPRPWDQNPDGMRIFIWAGLKSHQPGQHDYPQFLADWSKILTEHGAVVDGALHAPRAADLEHTDVVILYKGDAAYLTR